MRIIPEADGATIGRMAWANRLIAIFEVHRAQAVDERRAASDRQPTCVKAASMHAASLTSAESRCASKLSTPRPLVPACVSNSSSSRARNSTDPIAHPRLSSANTWSRFWDLPRPKGEDSAEAARTGSNRESRQHLFECTRVRFPALIETMHKRRDTG